MLKIHYMGLRHCAFRDEHVLVSADSEVRIVDFAHACEHDCDADPVINVWAWETSRRNYGCDEMYNVHQQLELWTPRAPHACMPTTSLLIVRTWQVSFHSWRHKQISSSIQTTKPWDNGSLTGSAARTILQQRRLSRRAPSGPSNTTTRGTKNTFRKSEIPGSSSRNVSSVRYRMGLKLRQVLPAALRVAAVSATWCGP